jgi:F0F1-type ATP synthase assembly protein I
LKTVLLYFFGPVVGGANCMPENDGETFLSRSLKALQENLRRSGPAVVAGYTLIAAIVLLGGIGYALDAWLSTSPWFLLAGLLLGIIVGFVELAKIVWRK